MLSEVRKGFIVFPCVDECVSSTKFYTIADTFAQQLIKVFMWVGGLRVDKGNGKVWGGGVGSSGVMELLGALRKFSFGGPRHLLSIDIYFKTLILVVFTESSGAL